MIYRNGCVGMFDFWYVFSIVSSVILLIVVLVDFRLNRLKNKNENKE